MQAFGHQSMRQERQCFLVCFHIVIKEGGQIGSMTIHRIADQLPHRRCHLLVKILPIAGEIIDFVLL